VLSSLRDDPLAFGESVGKAVLDWDTWADDPARAIGHLVPDAAEATTDVARTADHLDDLGDVAHLDDSGDALTRFDDVPTPPQGTWRGPDDPSVEPWLDEVVARHPELDRGGVRGVWHYTTDGGYRMVNGEMRSPTGDAVVRQHVDATNRGLDQLPSYRGTTYRGTNLPQSVVDDIEAGRPLTDPGFSSSSLNQDVARGFMDRNARNPTRISIEGHSGVNVQPFSAAQGEAEILFRGGTKFDVLSNYVDHEGVRHLVVREVP